LNSSEDQINLINLVKSKGQTLYIPTTLHIRQAKHDIYALLDSGASGEFIDPKLVNKDNLPKFPLQQIINTHNANRSKNASGQCTHYTKMMMTINERQMAIKPKIVALGKHQLFLGITWLRKSNPNIDWK
jgi:hypothetical protein